MKNEDIPVITSTPLDTPPVVESTPVQEPIPPKKKSKIGLIIGIIILILALIGGGIALFFLVIKPNFIDNKEEEKSSENWKQLYLDYLDEIVEDDYAIALAKIDKDDIPELGILNDMDSVISFSTVKKGKLLSLEIENSDDEFSMLDVLYLPHKDVAIWYLLKMTSDDTTKLDGVNIEELLEKTKWEDFYDYSERLDNEDALTLRAVLEFKRVDEDDVEEIFEELIEKDSDGYTLQNNIKAAREYYESLQEEKEEEEEPVERYTGSSYYNTQNRLEEIDLDELKRKLDNEDDFILLISQSFCSHCMEYKPVLNEVLEENGLYAYYIEYDNLTSKEQKQFKKLFSFEGTPTTLIIEDGEEKDTKNRLLGSSSKSKIEEFLKDNKYIK